MYHEGAGRARSTRWGLPPKSPRLPSLTGRGVEWGLWRPDRGSPMAEEGGRRSLTQNVAEAMNSRRGVRVSSARAFEIGHQQLSVPNRNVPCVTFLLGTDTSDTNNWSDPSRWGKLNAVLGEAARNRRQERPVGTPMEVVRTRPNPSSSISSDPPGDSRGAPGVRLCGLDLRAGSRTKDEEPGHRAGWRNRQTHGT